ncbi:MAG: cytochrome c4 [Gammaproteobacteria bacterium]|nr:MAG: cytochrome c4 [Gammaproteobacteria bacterium]
MSRSALAAGDATAGQQKSSACVSCHGVDGNGTTPLAGKDAGYLAQQLKDFRSGARSSGMMNMMAAKLSDADIADLAAFFAAQRAK